MSDAALVHLAGPDITAHGRYLRQRCCWCGAVLIDIDLARAAYPSSTLESERNPGTFEPGTFVRVSGAAEAGGLTMYERVEPEDHPAHPGDTKMPDGSCMLLPQEATA